MRNPIDRIAYTTAFDTPVVEHWLEQEIAQRVHPLKGRSDNPSLHEQTLLPRSYISLPLNGERRTLPVHIINEKTERHILNLDEKTEN